MRCSFALSAVLVTLPLLVGSALGCGSGSSSGSSSSAGGSTAASGPTTTGNSSTGATMPTSGPTSGAGGGGNLSCNTTYTDIPVGNCDLLQQDCSGTEWCNVVDDGAGSVSSACVPDGGGLKDAGSDCVQSSECRGGLLCVDSKCAPFCCPETHEPCGGGVCDVHLSFNNTVFAMVCSFPQSCTLFAGDCPAGQQCHIASTDQGTKVCDSPSGMLAAEGEACIYRNDCGDSQLCWQEDPASMPNEGLCRDLCMVSTWQSLTPGTGGCASGRECTAINQTAFPDLGLCTVL